MLSNKNSNNSTNIKCINFVGNTCLDWLLFRKEWLLYAQNLGVEEIITKGTYGGVDFKELRNPFSSKSELLSQFINKQASHVKKIEFLSDLHYSSDGRLPLVTVRAVALTNSRRSTDLKR